MIFSQLVAYFGRAGRQDVDGNLTGQHFSLILLACQLIEEENFCTSKLSLRKIVNIGINVISLHTCQCQPAIRHCLSTASMQLVCFSRNEMILSKDSKIIFATGLVAKASDAGVYEVRETPIPLGAKHNTGPSCALAGHEILCIPGLCSP